MENICGDKHHPLENVICTLSPNHEQFHHAAPVTNDPNGVYYAWVAPINCDCKDCEASHA